jgi:SAM-dependent methyltransferase
MTSVPPPGPELHPATRGFGLAAEAYERGRPDYPAAAIEWLVERLGIGPRRTVLDLAAGTGKLTRMLVPTGADVIAVEPIAAMRAKIAGARVLEGTAEAIPLADASVDAVTVAQAFHWFRAEEALREIHRVLRPGGGLGLIWNVRDESHPLNASASAIIAPLEAGVPRGRKLDWAEVIGATETADFTHEQLLDEDGFVQRFTSVSFVASAPDEVRADVAEQLRALARNAGTPIRLPYVTQVYVAPKV